MLGLIADCVCAPRRPVKLDVFRRQNNEECWDSFRLIPYGENSLNCWNWASRPRIYSRCMFASYRLSKEPNGESERSLSIAAGRIGTTILPSVALVGHWQLNSVQYNSWAWKRINAIAIQARSSAMRSDCIIDSPWASGMLKKYWWAEVS